ncbi:MAG: tetratricopeptide repeat protein [Spirochaetia bacterium]|jgi:tetratricopeptide (TPR) repeat protein|nr:tetratricopeptide repeat protein [Spirochaetia bacterium]
MKKGLNVYVLNKKIKTKFEKAINSGKLRKYEEAAELLSSIIKETDEIPEAYLYLGRSYHSLNRMNEAVSLLRHYLTLVPDSSMGNFFLGRSLLSLGLAKNSITFLKKSVEAHPESLHANGFLGIAYLNAGRSDVAIKYLSKAAEFSKKGTGIYKIYLGTLYLRAVSNFNAGDTELASQMLLFLIDHNFNNILPYIYMGMIERQNENYKQALSYYEKALKFSPDDKLLLYRRAVLLYKVGNSSIAVEELKKLDIEPDIDENMYLAYQFFNTKKFNQALYYGNMALHSDNQSTELHLLLGEINRELNNLDIAENHYRKAIKLDRTRLEGRYGLSLLLWMKYDYEAMITELKKISVSDSTNTISSYYTSLCMSKLNYKTDITIPSIQKEIRNNVPDCYLFTALGEEYIKAQLNQLAEKWFLKAISLNNNFKDAHMNLIDFYKSEENNDQLLKAYKNYLNIAFDLDKSLEYIQLLYKNKIFSDTISEINKVLPSMSTNTKLLRMLGNSYRFTKNWDNAILSYQHILVLFPENETVLQSLIYCLDHAGRKSSALELLDKAFEYLKSPSINLQLIRGVLYFKNKNYDDALKIFRKTLNKKPNDWRIYHNIGMIYNIKGVNDFAEQFFSRAREHKKK